MEIKLPIKKLYDVFISYYLRKNYLILYLLKLYLSYIYNMYNIIYII